MTSRRQQRDQAPDPFDAARLERELHQARKNRQARRAEDRGQRAEAQSITRVTGKHFRSRPTA